MIFIYFFSFLAILQLCDSHRRITGGKVVEDSKRYMVYLVKASSSPRAYDYWLCGGAIVSPWFIVTSAACLEDIGNSYAIAGYDKYVTSAELDTDQCTKDKKKKLVFTCVPKSYELDYAKLEKWANIDIGVAKVESKYDFTDESYKTSCSYIPNKIMVNYETKYQEPGIDAMVLGWGHSSLWRKPTDTQDYNQHELRYATALTTDKNVCRDAYKKAGFTDFIPVIDKYMICVAGTGNIDSAGLQILKSKPTAQGCLPHLQKLKGEFGEEEVFDSAECEEDEKLSYNSKDEGVVNLDGTRRQLNNDTTTQAPSTQGICQNDHGGPLITWVGAHEVLIGVASVFMIDKKTSSCASPYLFTSTQCNGAFLDCVINSVNNTRRNDLDEDINHVQTRRRFFCDRPAQERGFEMVEKTISWMNHPDGPAENEIVRVRPQVSINNYG